VPQHLLSLKKTYRSLSSILHKTNSESEILLINSSRNSSLQQISNNQEKSLRGIPALDGYQVVLMEPLYLPVKIRFIECAFESSFKCNFGFSTEKSNELNEVVITKGATAKLIVGMLRFLLN
jgi:hypothetical protein